MIVINKGYVKNIITKKEEITYVEVDVNGKISNAINYNEITGDINKGDIVYLNQTARALELGSGGFDFVIFNSKYNDIDKIKTGHIMKLRYTPGQINVLAAEEQESIYHNIFNSFVSLNGMPIIIGELHSMVAPIAIVLKKLRPNLKISYIMTDSACLPAAFSNTISYLKENNFIDSVITTGHAFGGDLETVNIYTSLICAKDVIKSDIAIIAMGPGIVGTGTKYGFSGIDQANIIDATNKFNGKPILIPRINFNDKRKRHFGISHHTITVLELLYSRCYMALPKMDNSKMKIISKQIKDNSAFERTDISIIDASITEKVLSDIKDLKFSTMGRNFDEEPDFFNTCGAAAIFASKLF